MSYTCNYRLFTLQLQEVCRYCGGMLIPKKNSDYSAGPMPYYCIKCGKDHVFNLTIEAPEVIYR